MQDIWSAPPRSTCAVSVVIPMFNTEKYIGVLLESLLAQTFKNFEVIVVNNCSTDNSAAVVESFIPKFGGRLKLLRTKKNSGGPGKPTNKGVEYACGKYIFFADSDDLLTNDALEKFYMTAENFGADVVQTAGYISFKDDPQSPVPDLKNLSASGRSVDKPIFLPNDFGERVKIFCNGAVDVMPWLKFVRRDLIIEHEIKFQEDVKSSQDITWTIELICYAERYLVIPDRLYIYRQHPNSVTHTERRGAESIKYRGMLLAKGAEFLCKFFDDQKFFRDNSQYGWMLLDWLERRYSKNFCEALYEIPPHDAQKVLTEIFSDDFGEHAGLIAYLCTSANTSRLKEKIYLQKIRELTARVADLERRLQTSP